MPLVNTLGKLTPRKATMSQLTTVLLFIDPSPKNMQNLNQKSQSTKKHRMFRAINLCQFREFYTNAVGDVGDIKKVCVPTIHTRL